MLAEEAKEWCKVDNDFNEQVSNNIRTPPCPSQRKLSMDTTKQRIIASVFTKRSGSGVPQETYVSHVKIYEETEDGGRKPRYILLSRTFLKGQEALRANFSARECCWSRIHSQVKDEHEQFLFDRKDVEVD